MSHSSEIAERILTLLKDEPMSFYAILQALEDVDYRVILQAWGILREKDLLARDEEGRYLRSAISEEVTKQGSSPG